MRVVCAVVRAAGAAAVCCEAGGKAVTSVPVCPRAGERVANASVSRSARWREHVAHIF